MTTVTQRLGDVITNIPIFMVKVYCALQLKWIEFKDKEEFNKFYRLVMEEQLRRHL